VSYKPGDRSMLKTEQLKRLTEIINLKSLAEKAGLKYNTIDQKLRRNTQLTVEESEALTAALASYGLRDISRVVNMASDRLSVDNNQAVALAEAFLNVFEALGLNRRDAAQAVVTLFETSAPELGKPKNEKTTFR